MKNYYCYAIFEKHFIDFLGKLEVEDKKKAIEKSQSILLKNYHIDNKKYRIVIFIELEYLIKGQEIIC